MKPLPTYPRSGVTTMTDEHHVHTCADCKDRRSATGVQLEIAGQMTAIKVLLQKHTDHMEMMGGRVAEHTQWIDGDHKEPGAKFYVAKWVARDKRLNQVKLLLIAGLATAAATKWVPGMSDAVKSWLGS